MEKKGNEYLENMDENLEMTEERQEEIIRKAKDGIRKEAIALSSIIKICETEEETEFLFKFLSEKGIKIRGIDITFAGEQENYKYIKRLKGIGEGQYEYDFYYKPLEKQVQEGLFKKLKKLKSPMKAKPNSAKYKAFMETRDKLNTHNKMLVKGSFGKLKKIQMPILANVSSANYKNYIKTREKLITHNKGLVNYIAYRFSLKNKMVPLEDLISMGTVGLIKAVDRFNPDLGYQFSTYAVPTIYRTIERECLNADKNEYLRIIQEREIEAIYDELRRSLQKDPTIEDIKQFTDYSEAVIIRSIENILEGEKQQVRKDDIEYRSWDDKEDHDIEEKLENEEYNSEQKRVAIEQIPERAIFDVSQEEFDRELGAPFLRKNISGILKTLTPREEAVIKLRFGIMDGEPKTLEEVAKRFNITRERIRQIEAKALRKLRHPARSRQVKDFLD